MELGGISFTIEDELKIMNMFLIPRLREIAEQLTKNTAWLCYLEYDFDNDEYDETIYTVNTAKQLVKIFKEKGDINGKEFSHLFNKQYNKLKKNNIIGIVIFTKYNFSEYNKSLFVYNLEGLDNIPSHRKLFIHCRPYILSSILDDDSLIRKFKEYSLIEIEDLIEKNYGKIILLTNNLNKGTLTSSIFTDPNIYTSLLISRMVHQDRIIFFKEKSSRYNQLLIFEVVYYLRTYFILLAYNRINSNTYQWIIFRNPGDTSSIHLE